jgi:ribose transport system permease protein
MNTKNLTSAPRNRADEKTANGGLLDPRNVPPGARATAFAKWFLVRYPMVLVLIVLMVTSQVLYPGFFELGNARNMAIQNADIALVALGMTIVMIGGGFDLSVGATYALGAVVFAKFADQMPLPLAGAVALGTGGMCGLLNGLVITKLRVNPFVATLGMGSVFSGLAFWVAEGVAISPVNADFGWLGDHVWLTFPVAAVLVAILYVLTSLVMSGTVFGRSVYAVGGNPEAANLAGMRVQRVQVTSYVLANICAAGAGIIMASRTGVGQADLGAAIPLAAITIVIVGGTSLFGGEGSVLRTVIGVLVMATIANLFNRMAVSTTPQLIAQGLIVVAAVALDVFTRKRFS